MHPLAEKLLQNSATTDLVKKMSPTSLMRSLVAIVDLLPAEAAEVVRDLRGEGIGVTGPTKEVGSYPVPALLKKNPQPGEISELGIPAGQNSGNAKHDFKRHHFPPDPRGKPAEWPFDAATVQAINPQNKGSRRPLMNGAEEEFETKPSMKKLVFKGPFDTDHRLHPDGNATGGTGLNQRAFHSKDNNTSSSGRSWTKRGYPGWSAAPKDKTFTPPPPSIKRKVKAEFPEVEQECSEEVEELPGNEIPWEKEAGVGSSVPRFVGGTNPPPISKAGHRSQGKR